MARGDRTTGAQNRYPKMTEFFLMSKKEIQKSDCFVKHGVFLADACARHVVMVLKELFFPRKLSNLIAGKESHL